MSQVFGKTGQPGEVSRLLLEAVLRLGLEVDLAGELDGTRSSAVRCITRDRATRCRWREVQIVGCSRRSKESVVRECCIWVVQIRMVQDVESFCTELEYYVFPDLEVLED